jgi:hypothetical protein
MITTKPEGKRHRIFIANEQSNFFVDEFVHQNIYNKLGAYSIRYINPNLIMVVQILRTLANAPFTINNYISGGKRTNSGLRDFTNPLNATMSVHFCGMAVDIVSSKTTNELYDLILKHEEMFIEMGLTTIEDVSITKTWLHLSVENIPTVNGKIRIIKP